VLVVDDLAAQKQAAIGARFGGQITPAMAAVAKKHKLDASWLGDPTNVNLIDGNAVRTLTWLKPYVCLLRCSRVPVFLTWAKNARC
jgi:hypothetical protein